MFRLPKKILLASLAAILVLTFVAALSSGVPALAVRNLKGFIASVFFVDSVTEAGLKEKYLSAQAGRGKVKILIVPGHDGEFWGTDFRGVKEADLTAVLGRKLADFLKKDDAFEVVLARSGDFYEQNFLDYFSREEEAINSFIASKRGTMEDYIEQGLISENQVVFHNKAAKSAALKLWGFNKWANENGTDIVLHIHLNDYPGRPKDFPGKYSGVSVYVPEKQYSNAKASQALAGEILSALKKFYPVSDYKKESSGVVSDQELIAIGVANSLDGVGMLVEYGYIYEPQFLDEGIAEKAAEDLAYRTFIGLEKFFNGAFEKKFGTSLLPHNFSDNLVRGLKNNSEVAELQAALREDGSYPPAGFSKKDCPMSGNFLACTERAVAVFQSKYAIRGENGAVGEKTRAKLNEFFEE